MIHKIGDALARKTWSDRAGSHRFPEGPEDL